MVGSAIIAIDSVSGSISVVSAMTIVGRPSPTSPFTVPASRNTASPKAISVFVTSHPYQISSPRVREFTSS